jgi:2-hydroxychromene-2-carboxylate isomerase
MKYAVKLSVGLVASAAAGMLGMWALDRRSAPEVTATPDVPPAARSVRAGAVKVELFVMSQCPYGVQAEQAFEPVLEKLGADIDYHVEYIGERADGGGLESMHGASEVKGDLVQACAANYSPKWPEFIACQNAAGRDVDTNWKECAKKIGLAPETIAKCADGSFGRDLLAASFDRAKERGATGSPTIYIGGTEYEGSRRFADLMRGVCRAFTGEAPAACRDIPEPPKVNVTLIGDRRCGEDCDLAPIEAKLHSVIASPVITKVDYADAAGKALASSVRPTTLPAIVFDSTLDADPEALAAVGRGAEEVAGHRVLHVGSWNPACADTGGCKLDACKGSLQCRREEPKKLEVFVMSQCPFGVKGLDAMRDVLDHFSKLGEKIDFSIHHIGDGTAEGGLSSMHGPAEVDEDIRQACAIAHHGKDFAFMKYIWCRNPSIRDPNWKECTGGATGVDAAAMETCATGDEGKRLLEKSFAASKAAGIDSSPTWIVNGKFQFSGIDANTIKTQLCAHNKLRGCDATLAGAAVQNGASPGCSE